MRAAGLLDTALINSYNSFWLALLAKGVFFLLLKKGIFENRPSIVFATPLVPLVLEDRKPQGREDVAGYAIASARVLVSSAEPVP